MPHAIALEICSRGLTSQSDENMYVHGNLISYVTPYNLLISVINHIQIIIKLKYLSIFTQK